MELFFSKYICRHCRIAVRVKSFNSIKAKTFASISPTALFYELCSPKPHHVLFLDFTFACDYKEPSHSFFTRYPRIFFVFCCLIRSRPVFKKLKREPEKVKSAPSHNSSKLQKLAWLPLDVPTFQTCIPAPPQQNLMTFSPHDLCFKICIK